MNPMYQLLAMLFLGGLGLLIVTLIALVMMFPRPRKFREDEVRGVKYE